jgi:hypothetical protein
VLVVDDAVAGDATGGIVGIGELGPTVGDTPVVGTNGAELTPRLLISIEPNGIPARAPPLGVVDDVDVGFDDEATLLEPEPHIPDNPDVSSMPEDVDTPDVAEIAVEVDIPDVDVPDGATPPVVAAVAGVVVPVAIAIPPPS